jgi:hypothetical protein
MLVPRVAYPSFCLEQIAEHFALAALASQLIGHKTGALSLAWRVGRRRDRVQLSKLTMCQRVFYLECANGTCHAAEDAETKVEELVKVWFSHNGQAMPWYATRLETGMVSGQRLIGYGTGTCQLAFWRMSTATKTSLLLSFASTSRYGTNRRQ